MVARGCDDRAVGTGLRRSRSGTDDPVCVVGGRTQWAVGGSPASIRAIVHAPVRHRRLPPGRDDRAARRGHHDVRARHGARGSTVRRPCSKVHPTRPSAACSQSATAGCAVYASGLYATRCLQVRYVSRRRPAHHRRRPDRQERHGLRPLPADGRLARHARLFRRGHLAHAAASGRRPVVVRAPVIPSLSRPSCIVRPRCFGTATRRGCTSRGTTADVTAAGRASSPTPAAIAATGHPRYRPVRSSVAPSELAAIVAGRRRSLRRRDRRRRGARATFAASSRSTPRPSSNCTAGCATSSIHSSRLNPGRDPLRAFEVA